MSADFDSLWGEEFNLPKEKEKTKKIVEKISKPKEVKAKVEKQIKSKAISLEEKLKLINEEVLRVLGKQRDNVLVIKSIDEYNTYIDKCINNKIVATDTETNNSLDPVTCKLMGLCLYTPGEKQVYIPVNHRNWQTGERLAWQLTEADIAEGLTRLFAADIFNETHNGKFDYEVIKCTCGVEIPIDWDTEIGEKLLDENYIGDRPYSLKNLYIRWIDPDQEKYKIDELFENVEYADVDPEIFALYAAHDSGMTHELAEHQFERFKNPDLSRVLTLAKTVEMPLVQVIAEMELAGMEVDFEYADRLSYKYHKNLDSIDLKINKELEALESQVMAWRLTPDANFRPKKKSGDGDGKSKNEQLTTPINLASPTQLAILFYDILKCPTVNSKKPRAVGEEELNAIAEKTNLPICKLLVERRGIVKLLTTYIDAIPELAKQWPDNRVRTHFNQYGAATGRLSSSKPVNF